MKGKVMNFNSILTYIKNLFNIDTKLKPLLFIVNIKNIKIDPEVLNRYTEYGVDVNAFDEFEHYEYKGFYNYTKSNKNYTLAQHKDWCLNEFKARYKVPDGLIIDCDCEVYLSYATLKDWKAYCNDDDYELKTFDKKVF
jgi:hypothetical protein